MANVLAATGFSHVGNWGGAAPNFELIIRRVASTDTTKIFQGDPVKSIASGYVSQWTAGTAVSQLAGIFSHCRYLSVAQKRVVWSNFWPGSDASGDVEVYLIPCNLATPALFVVQTNNSAGGATAFALTDVGQNIDVALGTGSTQNGISAAYADQNTEGVTATLPFRIVGLYSDYGIDNGSDNSSANNKIIVVANVAGAGSTGI